MIKRNYNNNLASIISPKYLIHYGVLFLLSDINLLLKTYFNASDKLILYSLFFMYYLIIIVCFVKYFRRIINLIRSNVEIFLLFVLCLFSTFRSSDIRNAIFSVIGLVSTSIYAIYLTSEYSNDDFADLILGFSLFSELINIIFIIFVPQFSIFVDERYNQAYRGIYPHKNTLGFNMGLFFIISVVYLIYVKQHNKRKLGYLSVLMSTLCIFLSKSITPIIVCILTIFVLLNIIIRKRFNFWYYIIGTILSLFFIILFKDFFNQILVNYFNRDITLTGRSDIWLYAIYAIKQRLWIGYGYNSFWLESNNASAIIGSNLGWNVGGAHNGYLDLILQIGILGLSLYLFMVLKFLFTKRKVKFTNENKFYLFGVSLFIFLIIYNLSENFTIPTNSFLWVYQVAFILLDNNYIKDN